MKNTLFCLFIFCSVSTFAQNGITFKVEKLSKPEELLHIPLVWSDGVKFPEYLMLVSGLFTDVPIDISLKPAP